MALGNLLSQIANPQTADVFGRFQQGQLGALQQQALKAQTEAQRATTAQSQEAQGLQAMFYDVFAASQIGGEGQNKLLKSALQKAPAKYQSHLQQILSMPVGSKEREVEIIKGVQIGQDLGFFGDMPNELDERKVDLDERKQEFAEKKFAEGGGDAAKQKTGAFLVRDPVTGKKSIAVGSYDPTTGTLETKEAPLGDLEVVSKLGETAREQTERRIDEAGGTESIKGEEKRASELIQRGILAAESTAVIRRGIELLETVKTGGINAVALSAKRLFGVEGADEGELSNSLGKAVLSQLRETFGAQFTKEEGMRLERIEAAFGKSPEANKRLLVQTLRIAESTANRARRAAIKRGDADTAKDITELLKFTLAIPEVVEEATGIKEGSTATNPQTGEKLIFTNGQWVKQ